MRAFFAGFTSLVLLYINDFFLLLYRISIIFRVKSAKAVKITDIDLIKRLGLIVGAFVLCLLIRTLVSPPVVIIGKKIPALFLSCQNKNWPEINSENF